MCLLHMLLKVLIIPNNLQTWAAAILLQRECSLLHGTNILELCGCSSRFHSHSYKQKNQKCLFFFFLSVKSQDLESQFCPSCCWQSYILNPGQLHKPQFSVTSAQTRGLQQPHRMLREQAQVVQALHRKLPTAESLMNLMKHALVFSVTISISSPLLKGILMLN